MSDKQLTVHEPQANDVLQIVLRFKAGKVQQLIADATLRTTPPGEAAGANLTQVRSALPQELIKQVEALLPVVAVAVAADNGFD